MRYFSLPLALAFGIVSALSTAVSAQERNSNDFSPRIHRGNWELGLSGSLKSEGYTQTVTGSGSSYTENQVGSSFTLDAKAGYFVANRFAIGIELQPNTEKTTTTYNASNNSTVTTSGGVFFGPYARYYFRLTNRLSLYPEVALGLLTSSSTSKYVDNNSNTTNTTDLAGLGGNGGLGLAYFLNPHVALNIAGKLNWAGLAGTYQYPNGSATVTQAYANLGLFLGLQVYLGN